MSKLKLVLKGQWYGMIATNQKREEYREVTPFWLSRLLTWNDGETLPDYFATDEIYTEILRKKLDEKAAGSKNREIRYKNDDVEFYLGYATNRPSMTWKIESIRIAEGNPVWGAEPGKRYFVIKLGERLA